jgi:hypothetical protein
MPSDMEPTNEGGSSPAPTKSVKSPSSPTGGSNLGKPSGASVPTDTAPTSGDSSTPAPTKSVKAGPTTSGGSTPQYNKGTTVHDDPIIGRIAR